MKSINGDPQTVDELYAYASLGFCKNGRVPFDASANENPKLLSFKYTEKNGDVPPSIDYQAPPAATVETDERNVYLFYTEIDENKNTAVPHVGIKSEATTKPNTIPSGVEDAWYTIPVLNPPASSPLAKRL